MAENQSKQDKQHIRDEFGSGTSDIYDVTEQYTKIHSQSDILNKDFTVAWTTGPLEKWCRTQLICAKQMYDILKDVDLPLAEEAMTILTEEVRLKLAQTRSRDGRVFKNLGRVTAPGEEEDESESKELGFLRSLFKNKTEEAR